MAMRLSRRKIANYVAHQIMAGVNVNQIVKELAAFLVDTKRTNEVGLVVRDVEYELSKKGVVLTQVTSAQQLTEATRQAVVDMVKNKTGAETVHLHQVIDAGVLGGVKIDLPGLQYDGTVARKLTTLRTNYKK